MHSSCTEWSVHHHSKGEMSCHRPSGGNRPVLRSDFLHGTKSAFRPMRPKRFLLWCKQQQPLACPTRRSFDARNHIPGRVDSRMGGRIGARRACPGSLPGTYAGAALFHGVGGTRVAGPAVVAHGLGRGPAGCPGSQHLLVADLDGAAGLPGQRSRAHPAPGLVLRLSSGTPPGPESADLLGMVVG